VVKKVSKITVKSAVIHFHSSPVSPQFTLAK
jgi:hypothetical protein